MRVPALLAPLLVALALGASLPAAPPRMPIDDVRPGMRGTGITVFEGSERVEFDVEVLGILKNVLGPRRDIVVARLSGGPLATTGVVQGMSGSPVYIDGRLVGAVAYSMGTFSKDAIAGITPIAEMIAADDPASRTARRRPGSLPATADELARVISDAVAVATPAALRAPVEARGLSASEAATFANRLRPIATPLVLSGLAPEVRDFWSAAVADSGIVTTVGGVMTAQAQSSAAHGPIQPGDAVGAALVRGDLMMAGTGTVTMVDGDRVYAFGHAFYNLGPARLPMTRAHVTALIPSLALSSKIAAIGDVVGTIDQDRSTGIYGTLGAGPSLIPVRIRLDEPTRAARNTFNFEIIDDPVLTPVLAYTATLNTMFSWTRELGPGTYDVRGTAELRDLPPVAFGDVYTGPLASASASAALAAPLSMLLGNTFAQVSIERIDINVTATEEPLTANLERVWIDARRPRSGDRVPLKVLSRTYGGTERIDTLEIAIPDHASGSLTIDVSDAPTRTQQDRVEGRSPLLADSLDELIRDLNAARRSNRLYVRLLRSDVGVVERGEPLPALPRSVLAVLEDNQSGGNREQLAEATLAEWELVTDHAISGSRRLTIDLAR